MVCVDCILNKEKFSVRVSLFCVCSIDALKIAPPDCLPTSLLSGQI